MTKFGSIRLENWRQFASVSIDFHPRLTIITGSNGAGKSTILNICSQHFGYSRPFLATPRKKKGGGIAYDLGSYDPSDPFGIKSGLFEDELDADTDEEEEQLELLPPYVSSEPSKNTSRQNLGSFIEIGYISYEDGVVSTLGFQENQAQSYGIQIINQQPILGVPISSHRAISTYKQVQGLSLQLITISNAYQLFLNEYINRIDGNHTQFSPIYRMKETLIAMAAFGEGNQHLEKNELLSSAFDGFGKILRKILPREIGFQKIIVRVPDIVLKTRSGEFILDASSGGLTAVIEIAWQIYLFSLENDKFVVTLDEPENHLHPSMQRSILSSLISAFPQVQFIVATHSPFIVSAVKDSCVYALKYEGPVGQSGFPSAGPRRVRSVALDQTMKAGTASEILRSVLGVPVTLPLWAESDIERIASGFELEALTSEKIEAIRSQLANVGLSDYYAETLSRIAQRR